jgi:hypothetical protein
MNITKAAVEDLLRMADKGENPNIQPAIILNQNIDPLRIAECTSTIVNDSWAEQLKDYLEEGWIIFRMQTEFSINGHQTIAYIAKLRPE